MTDNEKRARHHLGAATPEEARVLARMAMVTQFAYAEMSPAGQQALNELLSALAPDLLLALRATSMITREITRRS